MEALRTHIHKPHTQLIAGAVLLFIVFLALGAFIAQKITPAKLEAPQAVTQKVQFPVYLPKKLPGTYSIEPNSYVVRESALLFGIKDKDGNKMAFSQQARTTNLNFAAIYEQQFKSAQKLDGVPHPSVIGKTNDEKMHLLSIETPETWILITASSTNDGELQAIAKHISKQ